MFSTLWHARSTYHQVKNPLLIHTLRQHNSMTGTLELRLSIPVRSSRFLYRDTLTCVNTVPCCDMSSQTHIQMTILCAHRHIRMRGSPPLAQAVSYSLSSVKNYLWNDGTTFSTDWYLHINRNYDPPWIALNLVTAHYQRDSMAPPPCPTKHRHPPPLQW